MPHRLVVALALASATCSVLVGPAAATPEAPVGPTGPPKGSIVVRAAGDRDPVTGAAVPLAGARIAAYTDPALTTAAGACTTDPAGTCTITGLAAGVYRVGPVDDPPGGAFHRLGTVSTSLDAAGPYAEAVVVDEGTPTTHRFVYRRTNPPFPARCGVGVTLLYDLSGSIAPDEATQMERASLAFVDALAGTPSAIAVASFATAAPAAGNVDLAPTSVAEPSGVATVKAAVSALTLPAGDGRFTNWDAALRSVVGQSDVVVLFTDGNPTVHGVPAVFPPVQTGLDQIDAGVLSANAVKASGARVLAVGVGNVDEVAPDNLAAVSGPVEGSDYAITTFADVGTVFRALADALCPRPGPPVVVSPAPEPEPAAPTPRFTG